MSGEYLSAFKSLLKEFLFCLPEYRGKPAEAALYSCFHAHMYNLAELRARTLSGEHDVPYEQLEFVVDQAFQEHRDCPKGYGTDEMRDKCPFAWRLDYLCIYEDEMRRLGS
jgi:hypothetical protein